ncbi:inorganic phosphate transporter [Kordiimonas lacus]|uniref:Phosphate transporter n=1 Tax=Kordiimonas lacus TaxID=637679 RepID=A0A1G6U3S5_9PROT|nr:inorganic phosphate transporter [Kordiimonas lacus]SDD35988.1 inorganic phosphate transporter, PiT family [Kordiimonas lacus]
MVENHPVNKDLKKIQAFRAGMEKENRGIANLGVALVFLVLVLIYTAMTQSDGSTGIFVIAAAVIGGYMAMNIGANDVANNIGPAVGSKALTMVGALLIAAVFEAAGALIAGGDVVSTIRKGIIDPSAMADQMTFIWAMMSALLAAALWLNLATWVGAPVSTTHSIVGGVVGAGIAAAGAASVAWPKMGAIAASWVISPLLGGLIAALFLLFIKKMILAKENKLAAAETWVPVLVGIMAGAFSMYLVMKGLKKLWKPDTAMLWMIGFGSFAVVWAVTKPLVKRAAAGLENRRKSVAKLFTIPLICSAALLSFAHGANDVANAVGPLAAIVSAAQSVDMGSGKIALPIWVMAIGAIGISIGLLLYGPKLIRKVGEKITKLNQMRAFCVALSAAITVIAASWLGLPVSSTHIAVGGVFGVGFLREYLNSRENKKRRLTRSEEVKIAHRRLVRRRELLTIAAAWVITVPASGLLSAALFYAMSNAF